VLSWLTQSDRGGSLTLLVRTSISAVSLSVARVPARSRRQRSSSSTISSSCATSARARDGGHLGYGIVNGAQYGVVAESLPSPRIRYGLPFGAAVWASGYGPCPPRSFMSRCAGGRALRESAVNGSGLWTILASLAARLSDGGEIVGSSPMRKPGDPESPITRSPVMSARRSQY
jgi:hypothetical protein